MADQKRRSLKRPHGKDQNDDENRNPEQQSRDTSHPPSAQASATRVSHNETHTTMDWDTTDRKTRDQTDHHLTSTDVERRENRTSCQDVQAHTSGDVVGTETHASAQSQETSHRALENQLVETSTSTQLGDNNTIINKTYNTYSGHHVHKHFHYSCPPPHHHHGDSSSSYHVPCPDCLPYHHKDHPPLAEIHRPQPESEPRHLRLPHHPVPQLLPGQQQTQQTESSQERVAQNNKARSQETDRQRSRASDVTPRPNVTRAEQRVQQEAKTGKTADREKKEDGQSQNTKTASESAETRRVCIEGVRDTLCILDSQGQALEPGDALWIGSGKLAIYVGNQHVVYCPGWGEMVVKKELAMTSPFKRMTVYSKGRCQVYPPRERVDRATAWIGRKFKEGDKWDVFDFPTRVYTGLRWDEVWRKGFGWVIRNNYDRRESDRTLGDWE